MRTILTITCLLLLFSGKLINALFEDQIGKFDWRLQLVGCPIQVKFDRPRPNVLSDAVILSTGQNVIACLSSSTGDLIWRQEQEVETVLPPIFAIRHKLVVSIVNDGRLVRTWDVTSGHLKWQISIRESANNGPQVVQFVADHVIVLVGNDVHAMDLQTGELKWTHQLDASVLWLTLFADVDSVTAVGGVPQSSIDIITLEMTNGNVVRQVTSPIPWFSNNCILSVSLLICVGQHTLHTLDVNSPSLSIHSSSVMDIASLVSLSIDHHVGVLLSFSSILVIYRISPNSVPLPVLTIEQFDTVAGTVSNQNRPLLAVFSSTNLVSFYDLDTGQKERNWTRRLSQSESRSSIVQLLFSVTDDDRHRELLLIGRDCTIELLIDQGDSPSKSDANDVPPFEWTRHEALSSISSVEMVDLPLSEAQANIETEFSPDQDLPLQMLTRRLTTQSNQLRLAVYHWVDHLLQMFELTSRTTVTLSDWLNSLFSRRSTVGRHDRDGNCAQSTPLERDLFNLHKLIVVTTLDGSVFGIDNRLGTVLWKLWLGTVLEPLTNAQGRTIPLFVQRSTAHYPFPAQCLLAVNDKTSHQSVLVAFDPITGVVVDRLHLSSSVEQIQLLPFTNSQAIQSVLVVDALGQVPSWTVTCRQLMCQRVQAQLYPQDTHVPVDSPIHLMTVDPESGRLSGSRYDQQSGRMDPVWRSQLVLDVGQKVVQVVAKRLGEHVHSQGRVLGDRSVLYKYSNPNLIALVVMNAEESVVHLVDSVTGHVLHVAKHAQTGGTPVHLVHCENWLVYSLWNDKLRRTQLNVLEMYEGSEQSDPTRFSSLAPLKWPPSIFTQAYVFPQGVHALAVTETDRGLTSRTLLVALPFGGLLQVPKMLLDPRRSPADLNASEHGDQELPPYMPELSVSTENVFNYNQTVSRVRVMRTSGSGLESTSLVFVYGLDLFHTRLTPSGTFDVLKDDFDHLLIGSVLTVLILVSVFSKKWARHRDLNEAWH